MPKSATTLPNLQVNIRTITLTPTQILRVRVPRPNHVQILSQPDNPTYPGHGFIVLFTNAELTDVNAAPLHTGTTDLRIRPEALSDAFLMMLERFTMPFGADFELVVNGTFSIDKPSDVVTVIVESIAACNLSATVQ